MPCPDPIRAELFRNAIVALADEMALTIYRTAYSGVLKNIMDFSTAICDRQGRLVAQGLALPGHLCSIPVALQSCLRHFGADIAEGDVLTMNDPYDGRHAPARHLRVPADLRRRARSLAWAATICHHTDFGGRVPGSNASDSTEIYAEGLRHAAAETARARRAERDAAAASSRSNVRLPDRVMGDLRCATRRLRNRSQRGSPRWSRNTASGGRTRVR